MPNFFTSILTEDGDRSLSSKRFIGIVGFAVLVIALFLHMFFDLKPVPENLLDCVFYITTGALLGSSLEKFNPFTKKIPAKSTPEQSQE